MRRTASRLSVLVTVVAFLIGCMATTSAHAADKSAWLKAVARTIAKKQIYPRSALAREIEGTAKVRITVGRDGHIATYDVIQPTGEAVLDRALERLMTRIDPLPAPPAGLAEKELTLVVPIVWSLH